MGSQSIPSVFSSIRPNLTLHEEKDFVASAERFVIIASAKQNCCGDNFNCFDNMNCHHNNYSCDRNK